MEKQVVLFEDKFVTNMDPICLTRPAFLVTCACLNLLEVVKGSADTVSSVVRDYLTDWVVSKYPDAAADIRSGVGPVLFLNASVIPDIGYRETIIRLLDDGDPFIATSGQRIAAALIGPDRGIPEGLGPEEVSHWLLDMKLPLIDHELFRTLDHQYDVIKWQPELFAGNLESRIDTGDFQEVRDGVFAGPGTIVPDTAIFHTDQGPVVLDREVQLLDLTYFKGPLYVGPGSRIIERSSIKELTCIGHTCKIGGEVEASVIEPYTNKQHHGFLGHSYVGSWVNLGAGTSNSDMKNTYGEVRLDFDEGKLETGMQFLGCVIGDFAKTAINTSIFTGKLIGVASMLYGFIGGNVPSFCNYAKSFGQITECPVEHAVVTQKRMFARRGVEQKPEDIALLRSVFEITRDTRLISDDSPAL